MKRAISLVIVSAMLFTFAFLVSCTADETPSETPPVVTNSETSQVPEETPPEEITEEMLKASKPNEYVPEKLAAGMEVIIGYSLMSFDGIGQFADARLTEELPKMGLSYTVALDGYNTGLQITNIENFITMGCAAILIQSPDISLLEDIVGMAEDAGTSCILYGDVPKFYMSGYTSIDLPSLGYGVGLLARAWIDQAYPDAGEGEIKVAVFRSSGSTTSITTSGSIQQAIVDDARCSIVYVDDNTLGMDAGFTFAQQAYTTDPGVRVFVGFSLQAAFGCNNFIMGLPDIDPDEFCVVALSYDVSADDFLAASQRGEGIFRGCVAGNPDPAWGHLECIKAVLFNNEERPVVRMQEVVAYSNGLDISELMSEFYYGVYA